jgi:dTDP-4-amino-4,6-dideoxygalactose transaminase
VRFIAAQTVDFVDIDPGQLQHVPGPAGGKAGRLRLQRDELPKVIIPVHLTGQPCDMDRIGALARTHGVKVIEDASHAIGARFGGPRHRGLCRQ